MDTILQYHPEKIRFRNKEEVTKKIQHLLQDVVSNLQFITDFDYTLTKSHTENGKCGPAADILRQSSLMSEEFKARARDRFDKLLPVEVDLTLTISEKIPTVIASFEEGFSDLVTSNQLKKENLTQLIVNAEEICNFQLRDQCNQTLQVLSDEEVPVLIFSAGFGDIIEGLFKNFGLDFPNIHVIANFMDFDANEKLIGFKPPLIHTFNKDESVLPKNCPFLEDVTKRKNLILLGDSIGDASMGNGVQHVGVVLKIGFLNEVNPQQLETFLNQFDIVLLDDQTMDFVNILLAQVCNKN